MAALLVRQTRTFYQRNSFFLVKSYSQCPEEQIKKSVFISQSNDIFSNLALEDWLYRHEDFSKHHVLLVWRNTPCVVIGRHQNPWLEANLDFLAAKGIELVRRNSGGGAVYHDRGNLNLTFFTPRNLYNRKNNLELIKRALFREWNLNVQISPREDLLLNNYHKVSGTASKLGRDKAYHHCTLLINADRGNLSQALIKNNEEIQTKATRSVPSPVCNLQNGNPLVSPERMLSAVGWEFLRTTPITLKDGGKDLISQQRGFQLVNPTDKWFPGIAAIRNEFASWEWRYAKTPRFEVTRQCVHMGAELRLQVEQGAISNVNIRLSNSSPGDLAKTESLTQLNGHKYTFNTMDELERAILHGEQDRERIAARV